MKFKNISGIGIGVLFSTYALVMVLLIVYSPKRPQKPLLDKLQEKVRDVDTEFKSKPDTIKTNKY